MWNRIDRVRRAGTATSDRREFLKSSLLLAGAAPLASGLAAKSGYQIGCWTRPWAKVDYPLAFDGIAEAGYKNIGLMSLMLNGKPVNIGSETTPEEAAALRREVEKRGLRVISVWGGPFPYQKSLEAGIAGLKRIIDNCAVCRSPSLLLGGVGKPEQAEPYYKVVSESCEYAASKRVRLSVKPHGGTNSTGKDCRKLVERVGHKNFGIFYDPGNIFYYSDGRLDPVDDAPSVDGLVVGMTVKDFRMPKEVMLTPGTGMVNFREVLARLKNGGFTRGPLLVECLDPGDLAQTNAQARKARSFVEGLVKG
ncbi:MAG TPA: sugar phosphate isomerase/epimerase [Bryobacteraceae bacterium]|nr:sugar phosphate isomerase/epimerase [Bryobacteraceae bacterium]